MTFEELKNALEADGKQDMIEAIIALIDSEKQKGIEASRKKNKENENLRKFKQAVEALGYEDGDLDEFTSSLISKTSKPDSNSLTLKSLNEKLRSLEDQLTKERDLRSQAEGKAKSEKIHSKLMSTLNDKVYGADLLVKSLIADQKVDLDGDTIVFREGDETKDFDTGIKSLLEQRQDILKTNQANGAGSKPNSQMPADISEILNSKDQSKISANIDKIKAHYGLKK